MEIAGWGSAPPEGKLLRRHENNKRKWEFKGNESRKSSNGQKDLRVQMNSKVERNLWDGDSGDYDRILSACHWKNILFLKPLAKGHLEDRAPFMSAWYLSAVDEIGVVIKMIKPQNTADKYIHLQQIIRSGFTRLFIHNCWCRWPFLPQMQTLLKPRSTLPTAFTLSIASQLRL